MDRYTHIETGMIASNNGDYVQLIDAMSELEQKDNMIELLTDLLNDAQLKIARIQDIIR